MIRALSVLAILFALTAPGASARSLKIYGSGVQDKKTGDAIALVCVGPEAEGGHPCRQMQFA